MSINNNFVIITRLFIDNSFINLIVKFNKLIKFIHLNKVFDFNNVALTELEPNILINAPQIKTIKKTTSKCNLFHCVPIISVHMIV